MSQCFDNYIYNEVRDAEGTMTQTKIFDKGKLNPCTVVALVYGFPNIARNSLKISMTLLLTSENENNLSCVLES